MNTEIKNTLAMLYGDDSVATQEKRYEEAIEEFKSIFGQTEDYMIFSAPGRTEVGGNHTDHNRGRVLAAGVSLDVIAIVVPTEDNIITVKSKGFDKDTIDVTDLSVKDNEINTAASLIRGVAAGLKNNGYNIGGFKAYTTSNVLKGSGLSSSAAFEVLIGTILSHVYNNGSINAVKIAQISQYAENVYFGKPSGLMDQMASSVGGFITIDFEDTANPIINSIDFDFKKSGHTLCIVDTKGNHADLTDDYASIPVEMKSVAKFFGKNELRDITKEMLTENIADVKKACGDRAVIRAFHFFDDNERVAREADALEKGDFNAFLKEITSSGNSSFKYLQNIFATKAPSEQGLAVGLYMAEEILNGEGACRVHGGGFAGTIQAFVPDNKLSIFKSTMEKTFGEGSCHTLLIRPVGGIRIK